MAQRDNLLKEAIADANMIRDTAVTNAKAVLEEAFKPHLASIISNRLRKEAALNEDNDATSAIGGGAVTVKNPGPKQPSAAASDSSHIVNPGLETDELEGGSALTAKKITEGEFGDDDLDLDLDFGGEADAPDAGMMAPDTGMGAAPTSDFGAPDVDAPDAGMGMGSPDMGGEEGISDMDLEAIIRELELDVDGGMGMETPQIESFQDPMAGAKVNGPIDQLKETVAGSPDDGIFKDAPSPKSVDGVPGGKAVKPGQEVTAPNKDRMMESEEMDLDEILREIEEKEEQSDWDKNKFVKENTELKKENRQYRDVVTYLRGVLQEVNMLNAKLTFANKLFQSFDMNVGQRKKVLETFDRATTVREVKLVFTTLAESFNAKRTAARKPNAARITEGMSSATIGSTKPKSVAAPVLAEGNEMRERFMKLAHITQSN